MNLGEKLRLARKLEELGVDIIEAGFPIASDGDFAAVKAGAKALDNDSRGFAVARRALNAQFGQDVLSLCHEARSNGPCGCGGQARSAIS